MKHLIRLRAHALVALGAVAVVAIATQTLESEPAAPGSTSAVRATERGGHGEHAHEGEDPRADLRVRVRTVEDGQPMPGVAVIVHSKDGTAVERHTGADGSVAISLPAPDRYWVRVAAGEGQDDQRVVDLSEAGADVRVELLTGHLIEGRVLNDVGAALPGAVVRAGFGRFRTGRLATSDAEGRYRLVGLPSEEVAVEARAVGSRELEQSVRFELAAGSFTRTQHDFVFHDGVSCEGIVVDNHGRPVPGAEVEAASDDGDDVFATRCDGGGRFSFPHGLPGAEVYLSVRQDGFGQPSPERFALEPGQDLLRVELTVIAGGGLAGRVADVRGQGFASVNVRAERVGIQADAEADAAVTTDDEGHFRFDALPPGTYRCRVVCPGYPEVRSAAWPVDLGVEVDLGTLVLHDGLSASGIALGPDGDPVPDVRIEYRGTGTPSSQAFTNDEGRFEITGLAAGPLVLTARSDTLEARDVALHVGPAGLRGATVRLSERPIVAGVVIGAEGAALAKAWIVPVAEEAELVRTKADGSFVLPLPPERARCVVLVCALGYPPTRAEVLAGEPARIVLSPKAASLRGRPVQGRVVSGGAPVPGVTIFASSSASTDPDALTTASTDRSGVFTIGLEGDGPWELAVLDPSQELDVIQVVQPLAEADLLQPLVLSLPAATRSK
jgi:uncharacterized GH25 family protein